MLGELPRYRELILLMRGKVAVEFWHSATFIRHEDTNGNTNLRYLDIKNKLALYFPRINSDLPGELLKPDEDFVGKYFFEW
jgi:hypothetical protein